MVITERVTVIPLNDVTAFHELELYTLADLGYKNVVNLILMNKCERISNDELIYRLEKELQNIPISSVALRMEVEAMKQFLFGHRHPGLSKVCTNFQILRNYVVWSEG